MNDLVIDLSKYNTVTDWNSVKRSVSGVIIRAGYRGYTSGIVVEDNAKFIENYDVLLQRLGDIDKELDEVRSRFVKEA